MGAVINRIGQFYLDCAIAEMNALSGRHQAEFVAYLYRMLADELTDSLHADISRVAEAEDFRYVDTLPWFDRTG